MSEGTTYGGTQSLPNEPEPEETPAGDPTVPTDQPQPETEPTETPEDDGDGQAAE